MRHRTAITLTIAAIVLLPTLLSAADVAIPDAPSAR